MHGKPRPRLPDALRRRALLLCVLLLTLAATPLEARELRRQMPFLRPLLMGDAYVAVGDEASVLLYNPAGLARLEDGSVEALSVQFAADRDLTRLLLEPDEVQSEYSGLTTAELLERAGQTLHYNVQLRLPFIVDADDGVAYGLGVETLGAVKVIREPSGQPALDLEAFLDETALWSTFGRIGGLSLGLTAKLINRAGIDKTIDAATLYASGSELDLNNDPDFQAVAEGEDRLRAGLDFGFIYELPGFPNWQPRFGLSVLNLGGHESSRGGHGYHGIEFSDPPDADTPPVFGELPLNVSLGFAISPTFHSIRYTFALDLVDAARTALDGNSLNARTRAGFEVGVGPHEDGTALFSVLFGWNAGHFGGGVLTRVWVFEIGFGQYTVEGGDDPGDDPLERRVILIAVRF